MFRASRNGDTGSVMSIRVTPWKLEDDYEVDEALGMEADGGNRGDVSMGQKPPIETWLMWDGEKRISCGSWVPIGICSHNHPIGAEFRVGPQHWETSMENCPSRTDIIGNYCNLIDAPGKGQQITRSSTCRRKFVVRLLCGLILMAMESCREETLVACCPIKTA